MLVWGLGWDTRASLTYFVRCAVQRCRRPGPGHQAPSSQPPVRDTHQSSELSRVSLHCLSLTFRCLSAAFPWPSAAFHWPSAAFLWPPTEILKSKHVTAGGRWAPTAPVGAHAAGWGTVPPNGLGEAAGPRYSTIAGRPLPDNRIGKPPLLRHWRLCGECVSELLFRCRGDGLVLTAHESGHDWLAAPSQGVGSSRSSPGLRTT